MMIRIFLCCLLLCLNTFAQAAPQPFTATYTVYRNGFNLGITERRLVQQADGGYEFTATTQPTGLAALFVSLQVKEVSHLKLAAQLLSLDYSYDKKEKGKDEHYTLEFDQAAKTVRNSFTRQTYPLGTNTYDVLGFTLAVMHDLQNGLRELNYTLAEKKQLRDYHLKYIGTEQLGSFRHPINSLKLEHQTPGSKLRYTLWCVDRFGYLPVRIQKTEEDGDIILLELSRFNQQSVNLRPDDDL